jgi:hypothetical protein
MYTRKLLIISNPSQQAWSSLHPVLSIEKIPLSEYQQLTDSPTLKRGKNYSKKLPTAEVGLTQRSTWWHGGVLSTIPC